MTMIYFESHRRRSWSRSGLSIVTAVVLVVFLVGVNFLWPNLFPGLFSAIAAPYWRAGFAVETGGLDSLSALLNENQRLKRLLAEAEVRLLAISAVEDENIYIKKSFGLASSTRGVLAAVLKTPPSSLYDELIIDGGRDFGFSTTSLVYAPGRILIGRIEEVLSETSRVRLFSSPGQTLDVLIGSSRIPAVASGRGGGQFEAELPKSLRPMTGDYVFIASPEDPPFGKIVEVVSDPASPFQKILFAPSVNIYNMSWVLIVNRNKQ